MKPPHHEEDPEVSELTNLLLRSFREDVPPRHGKQATLAALGIGVATTAITSTASALMGTARVGVLSIAKALAGGALAGAVVVGTSSYIEHRASESRPPSAVPFAPAAPLAPRARPAHAAEADPVNPPAEPAVDVDDAPPPDTRGVRRLRDESANAAVGRSAAAPASSAPSAEVVLPVARPSSLTLEIALLDEARIDLAKGQPVEALSLLDRYGREFGHGTLGPEAVVLRIDALLRQGNVAAARTLAEQFERAHPDDSHLSRIRSLLSNRGASR